MKLIIVFGLFVILAACAAMSDFPVACYVDASTQYMISLVDPFFCTYVIYSTAYIGDDLSFKTLSLDVDPFNSMLKKLKDRNPALRMLLGVGVKQPRLEALSQEQIPLDNFTTSMLKYVMENNYDGVEFTWLENEINETLRNTEPLTSFIKEFRGRVGQAAIKPLLVFVSLLDHSNHMRTQIDQRTLSQYTDFICLLKLSYNNEVPEIGNTVSYWQDLTVPKKLMMAVPKIVQQQNSSQTKSMAIKQESKVEQIDNPGLIIAKQVCKDIKSGQKELKALTELESGQSHLENVSWLLKNGFGGVGVVMLDIIQFNSVCLNWTKNETAIHEDVITGHSHGHSHHRHHHHRHHDHRHHRHLHDGHHHHHHHHHRDHKHGHHDTQYHHEHGRHSHRHHRNHHHG